MLEKVSCEGRKEHFRVSKNKEIIDGYEKSMTSKHSSLFSLARWSMCVDVEHCCQYIKLVVHENFFCKALLRK